MTELFSDFEIFRNLTAELHCLPRPRVYEGQALGVKGESSEWVRLRPVFPVAGDRMAYPLRVDAYLIPASGFKIELHFSVRLSFYREISGFAAVGGRIFPVLAGWLPGGVSRSQPVAVHHERPRILIHPGLYISFFILNLSF